MKSIGLSQNLGSPLSFFRAFRRRTFPPSVDLFDWRLSELSRQISEFGNTGPIRSSVAYSDPAIDNKYDNVISVLRLLRPHYVADVPKARFGGDHDGGYIMLDDLDDVNHALSLGVNDDDNWEQALVNRGIAVDQYDDSIDKAPTNHPLLSFHKLRIVASSEEQGTTLSQLLRRPMYYILKMDIEGSEWDCIDATAMPELLRCQQIIVEFHDLRHLKDSSFLNRARRVFGKLVESHVPIHVHANNFAPICMVAGIPLPDVVEVTFALKSRYKSQVSCETFPTNLDAPNDPSCSDIYLGAFCY